MPVAIKGTGGGGVTLDAGAAAAATTLTLPNVSGTILQSGTAVTVAQGGTGLTFPGTSGNVLTSNGTAWTSAAVTVAALSTASGSAPSYSARAWVNFDGTGTVAIRASGNVSSITDNGTGTYTVNLTSALPDTNGVVHISCNLSSYAQSQAGYLVSASTVSIGTAANGSAYDQTIVQVTIVR